MARMALTRLGGSEQCVSHWAVQLNGCSSVLRCNLGMALAKMGKPDQALATLDQAIALDPVNPLAKFERAGVLLALERLPDALAELKALRVRRPSPETLTPQDPAPLLLCQHMRALRHALCCKLHPPRTPWQVSSHAACGVAHAGGAVMRSIGKHNVSMAPSPCHKYGRIATSVGAELRGGPLRGVRGK